MRFFDIELVKTGKGWKAFASALICTALTACGSGGGDAPDVSGTPDLGAATQSAANQQPVIDSISLGCDLVLDAIALKAGSTANFTLFVDDESPLTLSYSIDSDDASVSTSTVTEDGVFTLVGVTAGETTMPIIVTDEHGLSSQLLLSVVVDEA